MTQTKPIQIGSQTIGDSSFKIWAGPCAIENSDQFNRTAEFVLKCGASGIRGGIYKLRTDSTSFQGLKTKAIPLVKNFKLKHKGIPFISEITDPRQIESLNDIVDIFQVGTRNMFNYELLKELGQIRKPIVLKRFFAARIQEWLKASEYILRGGNSQIILCERGIRTFETAYRNTLDLNAVAYIKQETPFPILVDPSHGTGVQSLVAPLAKAALAVGADGLLVEVHNDPLKALSDPQQSLTLKDFETLTKELKSFSTILGRHL